MCSSRNVLLSKAICSSKKCTKGASHLLTPPLSGNFNDHDTDLSMDIGSGYVDKVGRHTSKAVHQQKDHPLLCRIPLLCTMPVITIPMLVKAFTILMEALRLEWASTPSTVFDGVGLRQCTGVDTDQINIKRHGMWSADALGLYVTSPCVAGYMVSASLASAMV